jgi:transaldolase
MRATQLLHNLGQSLWLDNITRDLLNSGTLNRYDALVFGCQVGVNL